MKDHFSARAEMYAKYRPVYPDQLFQYILSFVPEKKLAWDCATGNGQTANILSHYFEQVYATDISDTQLTHAVKANNIEYLKEPAEHSSLKNSTVDLTTISQALHWFDFDEFYNEVRRVSKPGAIIAAWTYSLLQVDPFTDEIIHEYHYRTLDKYWDPERRHVDDGYSTIPFPFKEMITPEFFIEVKWDLYHFEGYLNTWSALQKFISANDFSPVPALMKEIKKQWLPGESRKIVFPVHLRIGYVQ